jgi:hypothetical protein
LALYIAYESGSTLIRHETPRTLSLEFVQRHEDADPAASRFHRAGPFAGKICSRQIADCRHCDNQKDLNIGVVSSGIVPQLEPELKGFWQALQCAQSVSGNVAIGDETKPVPIEKGNIQGDTVSFEVHDNAGRIVKFRLSLTGLILVGEAEARGQISKVSTGRGNGKRFPVESVRGLDVIDGMDVGVFQFPQRWPVTYRQPAAGCTTFVN